MSETRRPNILLVTADQWRGDCLGVVGHPVVKTPHLDRFGREDATVFACHYAGCAPCSPARASLYTGLHQMVHRVVRNGSPLDARFDNIAKAARRAGYVPTLFGYTDTSPDPRGMNPNEPTLRSYEGVLPGFEVAQALPEDDGPWLDWLTDQGREFDQGYPVQAGAPQEGERVSTAPTQFAADESQTAFLTGRFLDWVERREGDVPWFAHVSFLRPHPPFSAPAPYNDMYVPGDGPAYLRAARREDEPAFHPVPDAKRKSQKLGDYIAGAEGSPLDLTARDFDRMRAVYFGMISEVDTQMGRMFAGLKEAGEWENTLIVFTSDHGEMMGDHWMLGKGGYFEQSYHVPMMLKVSGRETAGLCNALTSATDVFPTLADVMGVAPEHVPNGRSLMPLVTEGTSGGWRDGVVWEFDYRELWQKGAIDLPDLAEEDCVLTAYRTASHLYVHSPKLEPLLFDLCDDPACLNNIAADNVEVRLQMAEGLLEARARAADQTLARHYVWDFADTGSV